MTKNNIVAAILFILSVGIIELIISAIPEEATNESDVVQSSKPTKPKAKKPQNKVTKSYFQVVKWNTRFTGSVRFPLASTASSKGKCGYVIPLVDIPFDDTFLQARELNYTSPVRVFEKGKPLQILPSLDSFGEQCSGASFFSEGTLYFSPTASNVSLNDLSIDYLAEVRAADSSPVFWLFQQSVNVISLRRDKIICEKENCTDPEMINVTIKLIELDKLTKRTVVFFNGKKNFFKKVDGEFLVEFPVVNKVGKIPLRIKTQSNFIVEDIILSSDEVSISLIHGKRL
jgi:hypothetical protein